MTEFDKTDATSKRADAVWERRHNGRGRTMFISVLAAGIVALTIGYFNDRDGRDRSVQNCLKIQEDRHLIIEVLDGSGRANGGKRVRKADGTIAYEGTKQGANYLRLADETRDRVEDCSKVHPPVRILPF